MNQKETIALARVLKALEEFTYSDSLNTVIVEGIDGKQKRVAADEFIRERTRLWRSSWITPPIREIVERYAKKNKVRLDAPDLRLGTVRG